MEPRNRVHLLVFALASVAAAIFPPAAAARALLAQNKALELAFPEGRFERRTAYLTAAQLAEAQKRGKVKVDSAVWTYYSAPTGFAYFDTHVVRTMTETIMVVLERDGTVRSVELLAFAEPDDYLPRESWMRQFDKKNDAHDVFVGRAIRNVTGATLTSQALADGVRRVMAIHSLVVREPAVASAAK